MTKTQSKKLLSVLLTLAVFVTMFAGLNLSASAVSVWSGWIKIENAGDLKHMTNNSTGKFYLAKDIDLKGSLWNEAMNFNGTLDGNGHCIKNFTSTRCGLFFTLHGATIKNVGLRDVKIKTSYTYFGGFAAEAYNTTFSNCYISGTFTGSFVGGFVGRAKGNTYENCLNTADITDTLYAAGFEYGTPYTNDKGSIFKNCINTGNILGNSCAAGITCYVNNQMTSCYNLSAKITATGDDAYIGGLAAIAYNDAFMTNCATVSATDIGEPSANCLAKAKTSIPASTFKKASGFNGLNFSKTWTFKSGVNNGFPVLRIYTEGSNAFKLSAPKTVKGKTDKNSIALTWSTVSGAKSYKVSYTAGKKWTTKTASLPKLTLKNLKPGVTYSFKIAPVGRVVGNYSKVYKFTTKSASFSGKAPASTSVSVKYSWGKVAGAEKYRVRYSFDKKTWKTKDVNGTSFTFNLAKGKKCYIQVAGVSGKKVGKYTALTTISR